MFYSICCLNINLKRGEIALLGGGSGGGEWEKGHVGRLIKFNWKRISSEHETCIMINSNTGMLYTKIF